MNNHCHRALQRDRRSTAGREEGQVLILLALTLPILVMCLALALDVGFLMSERRQTQTGADAGALAAAHAALHKHPPSEVTRTGKSYGVLNTGASEDNVVVNRPPTSGHHQGDNNYVEVVISKPVQKFFVGAFYTGKWEVSARAVAGFGALNKRPYALVALNEPGIYINGSTSVYLEDGSSAISNAGISSSGNTNVFSAGGSIDAVKSIQGNSKWYAPDGINPNMPGVVDPLIGTPPPPKGTIRTAPNCSNDCILEPGYYKDQNINISKTATLRPGGIYYFDGSTKLNLQNTNSFIKGNEVLLYFAGNSQFTPGNGNIEVSARATAPYAGGINGMLLWIANCSVFDNSGNGIFKVEGVIYAPCSHVVLHGTPQGLGIQVIVGDLVLKGNSSFLVTYREYVKFDVPGVYLAE